MKLSDSKPIPAWKKSGRFCLRNWMDPTCIRIRDLLIKLTDYYGERHTYRTRNVVVDPLWYADQNYFTILNDSPTSQFMWIVTWYKSRGQTDMILFQGTPAGKREAMMLLKTLRMCK